MRNFPRDEEHILNHVLHAGRPRMFTYKVTWTEAEKSCNSLYESFICIASSEEKARRLHPNKEEYFFNTKQNKWQEKWVGESGEQMLQENTYCWCQAPEIYTDKLTVELLGVAPAKSRTRVVLASYKL